MRLSSVRLSSVASVKFPKNMKLCFGPARCACRDANPKTCAAKGAQKKSLPRRKHMDARLVSEPGRSRRSRNNVKVAFSPPKDWSTRNLNALQVVQMSLNTPTAPPVPRMLLLPTSDRFARLLAMRREEYMAAGWRVLIGSPSSVLAIGNKVRLQGFARRHGLTSYLPTEFSITTARFPCIAKKATGEYGRNVHIATTRHALLQLVQAAPKTWVIQELVAGEDEIATTLVVVNGEIKAAMSTRYTYRDKIYVWPHTAQSKRTSSELSPPERLQIEPFVRYFTGVCNVNYKVRPDGRIAIFEFNPRVGADFCDAKVSLARVIVETASKHAAHREAR